MEQFGASGVPIPCRMKPTNYVSIWSNISIQLLCSGVPLCHYYTDNVLCRQACKAPSLYSELQRMKINVCRKFSLPVRTFSREISTGQKNSVQHGQNFKNHFPTTWRILQAPTSDQLGQRWGLHFLLDQSVRQIQVGQLLLFSVLSAGVFNVMA